MMPMRVGGVQFSGEKRNEGVRLNVISVTGWVGGGPILRKKVLSNTRMAPNTIFQKDLF